jgi:hypothetical protein
MGAIPGMAYAGAGVERPQGFGGWALSKAPAVAGALLGGPVGGLLGGIVGTPFADMLSDYADTRVDEPMREDFETTFGQIGGRRGYADVRDALNEPTAMSNESIKAAMDMMQAHAQVGNPDLQEQNLRDYETLKNVNARMQEVRGLMPDIGKIKAEVARKAAEEAARSNAGWGRGGGYSGGGSQFGYQGGGSGSRQGGRGTGQGGMSGTGSKSKGGGGTGGLGGY